MHLFLTFSLIDIIVKLIRDSLRIEILMGEVTHSNYFELRTAFKLHIASEVAKSKLRTHLYHNLKTKISEAKASVRELFRHLYLFDTVGSYQNFTADTFGSVKFEMILLDKI